MSRSLRAGLLLWLLLANVSALGANPATQDGLPVVTLAELPVEALTTLQHIKRGNPYVYQRDGMIFRNFERILPQKPRDYYHEYTVKTPGINHRGARRIVCGPWPECYYTADHYQTFKRLLEQP